VTTDDPHLSDVDLVRLRTAVLDASRAHGSLPRSAVLAVHAAAPGHAAMTVDFRAAEELGLPLVIVHAATVPPRSDALERLSRREREVATLVARGLANKEIAATLDLRLSTVKEHVHRILVKTGLPSRAALAREVGSAGG
jgi:DNA-binding NarL/FixJ family response regulator